MNVEERLYKDAKALYQMVKLLYDKKSKQFKDLTRGDCSNLTLLSCDIRYCTNTIYDINVEKREMKNE